MAQVTRNSHENFDRAEKIRLGSERSFGFTFAALFIIIGLGPLLLQHPPRPAFAAAGAVFFLISILRPAVLKKPNQMWLKLGLFLNKTVSPVVLGLLYYAAFVPTGLLLKVFRKDILSLKLNRAAQSYWIKSPEPLSTMQDQF